MLMQVILSGLFLGGAYALMAVGLSVTLGVMRIINLAHGLFFTLGSFITYSLVVQAKVDPFLSVLLTFLIVFCIGMFCERVLVRPIMASEMHVMISTFALAIFGQQCIRLGWGVNYLSTPPFIDGSLIIEQIIIDYQRLLAFVFGLAIIGFLAIFLKKTKIGKATRMVEQDPEIASVLGINVNLIHLIVYGLGAAMAAVAGGVLSPLYLIFPAMGWNPLLISFAIVILGGMGSITGTVVGGFLFGLTSLLTSYFISSGMINVVPFLAIIIVLLIRPIGIFGKSDA